MPSPFPGMNPYFEQVGFWPDFHDSYVPALRDALGPQIRPNFIVRIQEQVYIHQLSANEHIRAKPDVGIAKVTNGPVRRNGGGGSTALIAPARVLIPSIEIERQSYLEILDRDDLEVVAVIEVLSPTNKRAGPFRRQFLAKRSHVLHSEANFVEIDLLRGWAPMPYEEAPKCDYRIFVSRVEERPEADCWPIKLRDPLPKIPVPLRPPRASVIIDLQEVLHTIYDRALYKDHIYRRKPYPKLKKKDREWAEAIVKKHLGET